MMMKEGNIEMTYHVIWRSFFTSNWETAPGCELQTYEQAVKRAKYLKEMNIVSSAQPMKIVVDADEFDFEDEGEVVAMMAADGTLFENEGESK